MITPQLLYRITQGGACFGIVVEDGWVVKAAPITGAAVGESWSVVRGWYSNVELVPPLGWTIQKGMGGWRAVNKGKLWETSVYLDQERCISAAIELEEKAARTLAERDRLCLALRAVFREG